MASSQGTRPSKVNEVETTPAFIEAYGSLHFTLSFLFFSDNIMADVASKQQTTDLFLSTTVTLTRRRVELTKKKLTNLMVNLCHARQHSVQFFVQFFYTVKLHSLTLSIWGPSGCVKHFPAT
jgi:hypothetical protein